MPVIESLIAATAGAISFLNSIVGEAWTRYFILLAGLTADTAIGNLTGMYPLEGLLSFVVANVFGIAGFAFPVYYGVSSLLITAAILPLVFFLIKS